MLGSTVVVLTAIVAVAVRLAVAVPMSAAQDMPLPEPGETVLEDPLTAPGAMRASFTATGRNSAQFTDEGLLVKVTGKASETSTVAAYSPAVQRLTFADGEARIEFRFATVLEGTQLQLQFRVQPDGIDRYFASIYPSRGLAQLRRVTGGRGTTLAERSDLADLLRPDDWNSLAVRVDGPNFWVLLNDEPFLSAVDSSYETGRVLIGLFRLGNPDDDQETAMVMRNLRVSALADGDLARAPLYEPPPAPPAPPPPAFVPPVGTPPDVGSIIVEDPLARPGLLPTGVCPTGRASGEHTAEGTILKVQGKCTESDTLAVAQTAIPGLSIPDGELRLDLKAVSGPDRAELIVFARRSGDGNSYVFSLAPGTGRAVISKNAGGRNTVLASRTDAGRLVKPDDWNSLALRLEGPNLWLLVNDQPVLSAIDPDFDTGGVMLRLNRSGDPNDDEETAVLVRNLRVSASGAENPDRTPSYRRP